jgi:hypothetical protein
MMFAITGLFTLSLGLLAQAFVPLQKSTAAPACLGKDLNFNCKTNGIKKLFNDENAENSLKVLSKEKIG